MLVALFKNARPADLVRFLEYHLLLGVDHAILVDNSCGASATAARRALAPYIAANLVTHHDQFVCTELRSMMFMQNFRGGSSMARQLSGLRGVPANALVVSLDDDEFFALADPAVGLRELRHELLRKRVCAVTSTWRVFGSDGHRCHPSGPLLRRFTRRARTEREMENREFSQARREAFDRHLNTPFGGKPLFVYQRPTVPQCGTHWCDSCSPGLTNCAMQERGPGKTCEAKYNLSATRFWINHYAFQSEQHWELKKRRGRTNLLPSRVGGVPANYERVLDRQAASLLDQRVRALHDRPPLRACLLALFARRSGGGGGGGGGGGAIRRASTARL